MLGRQFLASGVGLANRPSRAVSISRSSSRNASVEDSTPIPAAMARVPSSANSTDPEPAGDLITADDAREPPHPGAALWMSTWSLRLPERRDFGHENWLLGRGHGWLDHVIMLVIRRHVDYLRVASAICPAVMR